MSIYKGEKIVASIGGGSNKTYNYNSAPIGTIFPFAGTVAPRDYLFCEGQSLLASDYPELYEVIGNAYGDVPEKLEINDDDEIYF